MVDGIEFRPARDEDLPRLVELAHEGAREVGDPPNATADDIAVDWRMTGFDRERHSRVAIEGNRIVGQLGVWMRDGQAHTDAYVAREARGRGIGTALLDYGIRVAAETPGTSEIYAGTSTERDDALALIDGYGGFEYVRSFFTMRHHDATSTPEPAWPDGVRLVRLDGDALAEAAVAAHDGSFIDHWNFRPARVADFREWLDHPEDDPTLWFIAQSDDGRIAGYSICYLEVPVDGVREGWVGQLGTTRAFRGIGLGRALLRHGIRELAARGATEVRIGVDAENQSGALGFYERAGFRTFREQRVYRRKLA